MSQVFGDSKRLVNDYMAASHAIGIIRIEVAAQACMDVSSAVFVDTIDLLVAIGATQTLLQVIGVGNVDGK